MDGEVDRFKKNSVLSVVVLDVLVGVAVNGRYYTCGERLTRGVS